MTTADKIWLAIGIAIVSGWFFACLPDAIAWFERF